MSEVLRRVLNLVFAVAQFALPALLFADGFDTALSGDGDAPTAAEPAGYAFTIWGPIYAGALVYAFVQLRGRSSLEPLFRRIGWLTAAAFGLTCGWLAAARYGPVILTVPLSVGMLACVGAAFLMAARTELSSVQRWTVRAPLALFSGWMSAAVFVNAAEVLPAYGFNRFGLPVETFSQLVIAAAAALALLLLRASRGNLVYAAAVLWALAAVTVANLGGGAEREGVAWTAGAAAAVLALAAVRVRSGARGSDQGVPA